MLEELLKAVVASGPVALILLWRLMAADKERMDEKEYNRKLQDRIFKVAEDATEAVKELNETLKGGRS